MKTKRPFNRRFLSRKQQRGPQSASRRGSTLLIVIALLGLLSLLGFLFYTFAAQERANAEFFAEAAKKVPEAPENYFDWALEQLIVGPDPQLKQSALWGKRHSLTANLVGRDAQPYTGSGVNLVYDPGVDGQPGVAGTDDDSDSSTDEADELGWPGSDDVLAIDQNFNGSNDGNTIDVNGDGPRESSLLDFNDSPAANWGFERRLGDSSLFPDPDIDYTYPDINNLFLGYRGVTVDPANNYIYGPGLDGQPGEAGVNDDGDTNGDTDELDELGWPGSDDWLLRVTVPSFHRPAYLRASGTPIWDWYKNSATARKVFRPHPKHVFIDGKNNNVRRFLDDDNTADDTIIAALTGGSGGFPFQPPSDPNTTNEDPSKHGEMGIWTASHPEVWELDADNDSDPSNGREGVWLDLDYPVLERASDSAKYIPLFSFTVYDADGLLNLNSHGNIDRLIFPPLSGGVIPSSESISESNLGLSPAEVNPLWAFSRGPAGAPAVFQEHFGAAPTTRWQTANMEWLLLNAGRADTTSKDLIPGRWAEMNVLYLAYQAVLNGTGTAVLGALPKPGVTGIDDDNNLGEGEAFASRRPFVHPLDFRGTGSSTRTGRNGRQPDLVPPISGNPNVWPRYTRYTDEGSIRWTDAEPTPGSLMVNPVTVVLGDDPMEMVLEPDENKRPFDEMFNPDDMAYLHLTSTDINNASVESRLKDLAPHNFDLSATTTLTQESIRGMFTTLSWGRKQFTFPRAADPDPGPDGKPGNAGVDDNKNGKVDDASELGWPGSDDERAWEFSADAEVYVDQNGKIDLETDGDLEFPPEFGVPLYSIYTPSIPAHDPFRPQLRRLLRTEWGDRKEMTGQFPLSINGLLDAQRWQNETADDREDLARVLTRPLEFRPLTPHPQSDLTEAVVSGTQLVFPPKGTPEEKARQQEAWARRDRQKMARDIYVLLYTLGGGDDGQDYRASNQRTGGGDRDVYEDYQLREMAQFAVNLIDAQDRDNIITKFEYDKDLSNGWFLDDDPFATPEEAALTNGDPGYDADYPEDGDERGVVYGVEAQQLTFSEILSLMTTKVEDSMNSGTYVDLPCTLHNDKENRYFTYIELRSMSPFQSGPFAVDFDTEAWQVRMVPDDATVGEERRLTLTNTTTVAPGGLYTIMLAGDNTTIDPDPNNSDPTSEFWADETVTVTNPQQFVRADHRIAPRGNPLPPSPPDSVFLDVMDPASNGDFKITKADGTTPADPWSFVNANSIFDPNGEIEFVLMRRLDPLRDAPTTPTEELDNPWIAVDREVLPDGLRRFTISDTPSQTDMEQQLEDLTSVERQQPLDSTDPPHEFDGTTGVMMNTLGNNNDCTADLPNGRFTLWQPHFDRDFASVTDVLSLLLVRPDGVTSNFVNVLEPPREQYPSGGGPPPNPGKGKGKGKGRGRASRVSSPAGAAGKFLVPEHPNPPVPPGGSPDNRWYRLFALLEVPTRTHRELGNPIHVGRVPGKVNLNTIRHPEVLMALLDDTDVLEREYRTTQGRSSHLPDQAEGTVRDWWTQFIRSRDQIDPYTGYILPGLANSRPFRSFAYWQTQQVSGGGEELAIEDTLLRSLPIDENETPTPDLDERRRLFQLGTYNQHESGAVDFYSRNRLMSKLVGNATTRSNVFIVFVSVEFFEAYETDDEDLNGNGVLDGGEDANSNGVLDPYRARIGGKFDLDEDPLTEDGHRGFFIIDRSDAEKAYNPATGSFDWRKMVKYRLTIN